MAWVWHLSKEHESWGANIDYVQSAPFTEISSMSERALDAKLGIPTFKSRSGLSRFKKLHSPPIGVYPVVDAVWRDIILRFVPADRIQFFPVRLLARGKVCQDFMWIIPYDRVNCIDVNKSDISRKLEKPDRTLIFGVRKFVHIGGCLGPFHLARDSQLESHILVSNELKSALSACGESSMFYQPEDVVTIDRMLADNRARRMN